MTDSTLGFWYFFQSLLAVCCSEAEETPRTVRANGQGGSLLWAVLCTRSRCVNRADGSSTPEDGIQRLEIWSGALCFSEFVFLPLKQYLENSVDCFFNSLRLLINYIRDPSIQRRKSSSQELTRSGWQSGYWNSAHSLFLWILCTFH